MRISVAAIVLAVASVVSAAVTDEFTVLYRPVRAEYAKDNLPFTVSISESLQASCEMRLTQSELLLHVRSQALPSKSTKSLAVHLQERGHSKNKIQVSRPVGSKTSCREL